MKEVKFADDNPMIIKQRAALKALRHKIKKAKKAGNPFATKDLVKEYNAMKKDLDECYSHLHAAGWIR